MLKFYICNSFTQRSFEGNPAGVVFDDEGSLGCDMMQKIAAQLNLVETTFVLPSDHERFSCNMRYFTPLKELPITGHPTLAAWQIMLNTKRVSPQGQHKIKTQGGTINIEQERGSIYLSQSSPVFTEIVQDGVEEVLSVFSLAKEDLLDYPIAGVNAGLGHLIFGVKDIKTLFKMSFELDALKGVCHKYELQEAQIFSLETVDNQNTLHTRNFCPREGLEDPACGNGNAALGGYFLKYIEPDTGNIMLKAEQGHIINKPSLIEIKAKRKADGYDIQIGGKAVLMAEGSFLYNDVNSIS